jgi:hypothetical protein
MDKKLPLMIQDLQEQQQLQTVSPEPISALLEVTNFKVCFAVSYKGTAIICSLLDCVVIALQFI